MLSRLVLITALSLFSTALRAQAALPTADAYFLSSICLQAPGDVTPTGQQNVTADAAMTLYTTRLKPQNWTGELLKEQLDASGSRTLLWRASEAAGTPRQIKMANPLAASGLGDFSWALLNERQRQALNTDTSGLVDNLGAARVLKLRREPCDAMEGCATLRSPARLADSMHSRPVSVAQPNRRADAMEQYDGPEGAYTRFKAKPRRAQVYLGANDGMLHGFDAETGEERLAFIPSAALPHLSALTSPSYGAHHHRFFVDGRLRVEDVFFRSAWHTVLVGSLGAGGRSVFALDITDPDHIRLLWEFNGEHDDDLGYLLGTPSIVRLHSGQWAAVFSNGQESPSKRAALLLVEIATGALIKRLSVPAPASSLSMPLVTDTNNDGNADYAYAGDNLGNLWRFDLYDHRRGSLEKTAPETAAAAEGFRLSFAGRPLFSAPRRQPITAAPAIVSHPTEAGYLIIIGTGQNHLPDDRDEQGPYSLYGVWDRYTQGQSTQGAGGITVADLQQQRLHDAGSGDAPTASLSRNPINWQSSDGPADGKLGWYLDLRRASARTGAERLLDTPQSLGGLLFVSTRAPSLAPCTHADAQRVYAIDPTLGARAPQNVFDLDGDGHVNELDSPDGLPPASISAQGAPVIVPALPGGMPCLLSDNGCSPLSLGLRANGRQSWRVVSDAAP